MMLINKIRYFSFLLAVSVVLSTTLTAQKTQSTNFKQLGGSPDEINQMRLPNPEMLGNRSRVAMLPIKGSQFFEIPVDNSENFKLTLISPKTGQINVSVGSKGEQLIDIRNDLRGISVEKSDVGFEGTTFPAEVFSFDSVKTGVLNVQIETNEALSNSNKPIGFLVVSSDSPYRLYSYVDTLQTVVGSEFGLVTSLFDRNTNNEIDRPAILQDSIFEASAIITLPNGNVESVKMIEIGDGNYRLGYLPKFSGKYTAQITVRGTNPVGNSFIRTSEHLIDVSENRGIIGSQANAILTDDVRFLINLPVQGLRNGQKVIAHAEIWGLNLNGHEEAVAWIGGISLVNKQKLALSFDSRWLSNSEVKGNYELRNISLQDADSSVVLAKADSISLTNVYETNIAKNSAGQINEEMRFGKRPANLDSTKAVGGKLMLVHGYCSGDAWSQTAQFSNFVKFLDLNQNRSHDQFANLIKNFGASLPSFGVIAHSQGGAATLHLYTYYWSGLDNATGSRLIQSVGTPYQGTALAGNLAVLGQIFGAGCGYNNDLTYSGAATWLSGIPSWARAKVYYHTTSFTDLWWRYDYCSLATDLFLGDPEDGVTEKAYGQLSGANNMGHKTGWCHTTSMRDPGQTTDSSRNTTMNLNAAR
jgi:hypothetical protein